MDRVPRVAGVVGSQVLTGQQIDVVEDQRVVLRRRDIEPDVEQLAAVELDAVLVLRAALLDDEDVILLDFAFLLQLIHHCAHVRHKLLQLLLPALASLDTEAHNDRHRRFPTVVFLPVPAAAAGAAAAGAAAARASAGASVAARAGETASPTPSPQPPSSSPSTSMSLVGAGPVGAAGGGAGAGAGGRCCCGWPGGGRLPTFANTNVALTKLA